MAISCVVDSGRGKFLKTIMGWVESFGSNTVLPKTLTEVLESGGIARAESLIFQDVANRNPEINTWRKLNGKDRKELFRKFLNDIYKTTKDVYAQLGISSENSLVELYKQFDVDSVDFSKEKTAEFYFGAISGSDGNPIKLLYATNKLARERIYNDVVAGEPEGLFNKHFGFIPALENTINTGFISPRRTKELIMRYFADQDPNKSVMKKFLYNLSKLSSSLMIASYGVPAALVLAGLGVPFAMTGAGVMLTTGLLAIRSEVDAMRSYDYLNNKYGWKRLNQLKQKFGFDEEMGGAKYIAQYKAEGLGAVMKDIFIKDSNTTVIPDIIAGKFYMDHAVIKALANRYDPSLSVDENWENINNLLESDTAYRAAFIGEVNTVAYGLAGKTRFRDGSNTEQGLFGTVTNILGGWGLVKGRHFIRNLFSGQYKYMYSQEVESGNENSNQYLNNILMNSYEGGAFMSYFLSTMRNVYQLQKLLEQYEDPEDDEEGVLLYEELVNSPLRAAKTLREGAGNLNGNIVALWSSSRSRNFMSIIDYIINTSGLSEDPSKSVYDYITEQTGVTENELEATNQLIFRINDMLRIFAPITKILIPTIERYNYTYIGDGTDSRVEKGMDAFLEAFSNFNGRYASYLSTEINNYVNSDSVQLYSPYAQFNDILGQQESDFKKYFYDQNFITKLLDEKLEAFEKNPNSKMMHLLSFAISQSDVLRKLESGIASTQATGKDAVNINSLVSSIQDDKNLESFIMNGDISSIDPKYGSYLYTLITKDYGFYGAGAAGSRFEDGKRISKYNQKEVDFFDGEMKRYVGEKKYDEWINTIKEMSNPNAKVADNEKSNYFAEMLGSIESAKYKSGEPANPKVLLGYMLEKTASEILKNKYGMNRFTDSGTEAFLEAELKSQQEAGMIVLPVLRKADAENWVYFTSKLIYDKFPDQRKYFTDTSAQVDPAQRTSDTNNLKQDVKLEGTVAGALFAGRLLALHEIGKGNIDGVYYSNNLSTLVSQKLQNAQLEVDGGKFKTKDEAIVNTINQVEALSLIDLNTLMKKRGYNEMERISTMAGAMWNKKDTLEKFMNNDKVDEELKTHVKNELYGLAVDIREVEHAVAGQSYLDDKSKAYGYNPKYSDGKKGNGSGFNGYSSYYKKDFYKNYISDKQIFANMNQWFDKNLSYTLNGYAKSIINEKPNQYNPTERRYLNARARFGKLETKYPVNDIQKGGGGTFGSPVVRAKKLKSRIKPIVPIKRKRSGAQNERNPGGQR